MWSLHAYLFLSSLVYGRSFPAIQCQGFRIFNYRGEVLFTLERQAAVSRMLESYYSHFTWHGILSGWRFLWRTDLFMDKVLYKGLCFAHFSLSGRLTSMAGQDPRLRRTLVVLCRTVELGI